MLELAITVEMYERAKAKAEELGKLKNSITSGKGNIVGFLGEELTLSVFGIEANTYQHDIVFGGKRFEVKSKKTTVEPKEYYEVSVAAFNPDQQADYYLFTRVLNTYDKGWILGYLPTGDFHRKAKLLRKGEIDPSNNYTVKANCYNLPIKELVKFP